MSRITRIPALLLLSFCLLCLCGAASGAAAPVQPEAAQAAVQAVPSADGQSIVVLAGRLGTITTPISASLKLGPTSHEPSHTDYDPTNDQYAFRFEGIAMPYQSTAMAIALTTNGAGDPVDLGATSFTREYLDGRQVDELVSPDNRVTVRVPASAATASNYWVLMNTLTPPADPPAGYRFLGSSYSLWGSGFITGTQASMLLTMYYDPLALDGVDPALVALYWRNAARRCMAGGAEPAGV